MASIQEAKEIMGKNYLGPEQINVLLIKMGLATIDNPEVTDIKFSNETLRKLSSDYLLVYGTDKLDIKILRDHYGIDPEISEPCFYNQDWYLAEDFIKKRLHNDWYLIMKNVIESSRAEQPQTIMSEGIHFPPAILCTLSFFAYFENFGEKLWFHDFIWCNDVDHNGDRIYVGKYHDVDGVNKNGFSIHRHLALRPCYAAVDSICE